MQADLSQRWEEEIRPRQTPYDRPLRPSGDPGGEQGCCRAVDSAGPPTCKFMESSVRQTAARKNVVDLGNPEWKTATPLHALTRDGRDALTQISKDLIADSRHRSRNPIGSRCLYMTTSCRPECFMFFFCSYIRAESSRSKLGISSHQLPISQIFFLNQLARTSR